MAFKFVQLPVLAVAAEFTVDPLLTHQLTMGAHSNILLPSLWITITCSRQKVTTRRHFAHTSVTLESVAKGHQGQLQGLVLNLSQIGETRLVLAC
jgi:hypothetical protein